MYLMRPVPVVRRLFAFCAHSTINVKACLNMDRSLILILIHTMSNLGSWISTRGTSLFLFVERYFTATGTSGVSLCVSFTKTLSSFRLSTNKLSKRVIIHSINNRAVHHIVAITFRKRINYGL